MKIKPKHLAGMTMTIQATGPGSGLLTIALKLSLGLERNISADLRVLYGEQVVESTVLKVALKESNDSLLKAQNTLKTEKSKSMWIGIGIGAGVTIGIGGIIGLVLWSKQ